MAKKKPTVKKESYNAEARFPSIDHRRDAITQYVEEIIKGTSTKQLMEQLEAEYDFTFEQCADFIGTCKNEIAKATATDYSQIVAVHTELYELLYRKFQGLDFVPGQLASMKQKEKIMGMLEEEDNEIVINNQANVTLQNTIYDMTKLKPEEKQRFELLMKKLSDGQKRTTIEQ